MNPTSCMRALTLGVLVLASGSAVHAQNVSTDLRETLEQRVFTGKPPALTGFSPTEPVANTPPGGKNPYTQAYRTATECVVFFYPATPKDFRNVEIKWNGPACNGQPLAGQGELQIKWQNLETGKPFPHISVLTGRFSNGLLYGEGEKRNFGFDHTGKLQPDIYTFHGTFEHSILNGVGYKVWTGGADSRPRAWMREGYFEDAVISGQGVLAQLQPSDGIAARTQHLFHNAQGQTFQFQWYQNNRQPQLGTIHIQDDPVVWNVQLNQLEAESRETALLTRYDRAYGTETKASCKLWDFDASRPTCQEGQLLHEPRNGTAITLDRFSLRAPSDRHDTPFRPEPGFQASLVFDDWDVPVTCTATLSECTGAGALATPIGGVYWHGKFKWQAGQAIPQPGTALYAGDPRTHGPRATLGGRCDKPLNTKSCDEGMLVLPHGAHFYGPWSIREVKFRESTSGSEHLPWDALRWMPAPQGWGRIEYANGTWARVRFDDDGKFAEVAACGESNSSRRRTCRLGYNVVDSVERYTGTLVREEYGVVFD